jgi:hypothetical protein
MWSKSHKTLRSHLQACTIVASGVSELGFEKGARDGVIFPGKLIAWRIQLCSHMR